VGWWVPEELGYNSEDHTVQLHTTIITNRSDHSSSARQLIASILIVIATGLEVTHARERLSYTTGGYHCY